MMLRCAADDATVHLAQPVLACVVATSHVCCCQTTRFCPLLHSDRLVGDLHGNPLSVLLKYYGCDCCFSSRT